MAALPDVGPAPAAPGFARPLLEAERGAGRVGGRGGLLAHQRAEIEEVLLGSRAFRQVDPAPLGDELGDGHPGRVVAQNRRRGQSSSRCDLGLDLT